jgi:hypothetical protein
MKKLRVFIGSGSSVGKGPKGRKNVVCSKACFGKE